eukprot:TRINITY_DN1747_c2_g1_i1.p1 TRINITY_DN1747_c2_g1~~TRINITY_DN1747_c2_g1_i1.p1  ORF type:complete len:143 (-),score=27.86 TRINITY_DN1747_c2_g1_i1:325-753(-)
MATVAAKGASMSTPIALFRNSFSNLIRTFSASAPSPSPSPSAAVTKKPKRKKKKNLFELAQFLPNWGIGYQMAKNHWQGISYQITKINLYKACLLQMLLRKSVGFTNGAGGISQFQRKQQKLHQNWRFKLELHPFAAYNVFS